MTATLLRAIDAEEKKRWVVIAGGMAHTGRPEESAAETMKVFDFRHGTKLEGATRIKGVLSAKEACAMIDELTKQSEASE